MDRDNFFRGNVGGTIVRLIVLSIVVGIVFSALGISPDNILYHLQRLIQRIRDLGFGVVEQALHYFLLGAVVVVPIWFIARLIGGLRGSNENRP